MKKMKIFFISMRTFTFAWPLSHVRRCLFFTDTPFPPGVDIVYGFPPTVLSGFFVLYVVEIVLDLCKVS